MIWKNYFKELEFRSPDNADNPVDINPDFLKLLNATRVLYGKPIHINSGHRSPEHNLSVGGAKSSQHLVLPVRAADLAVSTGGDAWNLLQALYKASEHTQVKFRFGLKRKSGENKGFIHVDIAPQASVCWTY